MTEKSLGVAVIGAGMVGRAHAAGYRVASQLYDLDLPEIRLVAIADAYEPFAVDAAQRFGYQRPETSWQAIVEAPDIDVVSVAIANELHRPVVEALLAAGKHVLCEKPLAPIRRGRQGDGRRRGGRRHPVGRRLLVPAYAGHQRHPGAARQRRDRTGAPLQRPLLVRLRPEPEQPDELALQGRAGHGRAGGHRQPHDRPRGVPLRSDRQGQRCGLPDLHHRAPVPLGATVGHAAGAVGDDKEPVENEDIATFTASFANGAVGTFSISRISHGLPNGLGFEVFAADGAAAFDLNRPGEFTFADHGPDGKTNGYRSVLIGPQHPGIEQGHRDGLPVGRPRPERPVRLAGPRLPRPGRRPRQARALPSLAHGLHNMEIQAAVTQSALNGGQAVTLD